MFSKIKKSLFGATPLGKISSTFLVLTILSTAALLISNIIANKLFPVFNLSLNGFGITLTCGVICFPLTYVLSDIFSEVYGYTASRRVTWLGFGANVLMVFLFSMADLIPAVNYQELSGYSAAFHTILGIDFASGWGPLGTLLASLAAFVVGSWIDDIVFEKLRNSTHFITRAVLSSFAGELIDSIIFIPLMLLFAGLYGTAITSIWTVIGMILIQVLIKTLYELLISPVTAVLVRVIRNKEAKGV